MNPLNMYLMIYCELNWQTNWCDNIPLDTCVKYLYFFSGIGLGS